MMRFGGRFHLQLTPLLDLLLIVIFAQYLDVQRQAERQAEAVQQTLAAGRQELAAAASAERAELEASRKRIAQKREKLSARAEALAARKKEIERRIEDVISQQRRAAEVIAELFDVPSSLVDRVLKPLPPGAPSRTDAEIARLEQRLSKLTQLKGTELIKHLLTYDELRKRADVWTIRIAANGQITFTADGKPQTFRARGPEDFAEELFARYNTLPEPKGLVIILISYGDARADVRQAVLQGMPIAIRKMREDQLGNTQFEYAVLGFIPRESAMRNASPGQE